MMIPPLVFSSSATRLTISLSYNGLIFILKPPFLILICLWIFLLTLSVAVLSAGNQK